MFVVDDDDEQPSATTNIKKSIGGETLLHKRGVTSKEDERGKWIPPRRWMDPYGAPKRKANRVMVTKRERDKGKRRSSVR